MAELTQDAVLHFLQSRGGTVPNAELLLHFRPYLRDSANRDRNRELFKKFVNSVARVKQEDGVSYVVLQRKYKGYVPGIGGTGGGSSVGSPGVSPGNVFNSPAWNDDKPRNKIPEVVLAQPAHIPTKAVLPAAGIVLNNNNNSTVEPNLNLPLRKTRLSAPGPAPTAPPGFSSRSRGSEQTAPTPQPQPAFTPQPQPALPSKLQPQTAFSPHVPGSTPKSHPAYSLQPAFSTQPQPGYTPQPLPASISQPVPASAPKSYPAVTLQPSTPTPQAHRRETRPPSQIQAGVGLPPAHGTPSLQQPREAHLPPALVKGGHPGSLTPAPPALLVESTITEKKLQLQEASAKPVQSDLSYPPFQPGSQLNPTVKERCPSARRFRHRPSYRNAVSVDDDDEEEEVSVSGRRGSAPLEALGRWDKEPGMGPTERVMSQSTPALDRPVPHIQVTQTEGPQGHHGAAEKRLRASSPSQPQKLSPGRTVPQIHVQDLDSGQSSETGHVTPEKRLRTPSVLRPQILPGSHSSPSPSQDQSDTSHLSSGWSSCEELTDSGGSGGKPQTSGPAWQRAMEEGGAWGPRAWHRSTGDLCDDGAGSSDGSTSSSHLPPAVTRRVSSNLRSRMCMSVGADLDQLMQEDDKRALGGSEAARLNRLHLISSSLSLSRHLSSSSLSSCSTPPRCHSLDQLSDHQQGGRRSLPSTSHPQESSSRPSHVPLEAREHMWLVKAAAGEWPDIYSLFREEPTLLHRRDFISGFTVLHWIAKHGDHRVLNTLWYGVEKAGMTFDTDAQSSCGYTPLHIAAMHNHKNIIRLLVSKFKADVRPRDASGRKAWFYLPQGSPPEVFQLLGAPAKAALGETTVGQEWTTPPPLQQSQRRRRRHHLSSASGERPLTVIGNTKVKRSTSLAAFLKHKSLQKVKAEWAI